MKKKMIAMLASMALMNLAYAADDNNSGPQTSKTDVQTKITDFELISDGSSPDCEKIFSHVLKEKNFTWKKGEQTLLPGGHAISHKERIMKSYSDHDQVLVRHKVQFNGQETADVIVGFSKNKTNKDEAASGLMMVINWVDAQGKPEDRTCLFSFKETLEK
ncbi:hypothetical protein ACTAZI_03110 [Legionella bozemanae]|uniref:hypothetical protein n=1 Tax=Legionella bozemanae TaxID=447 RepID=UPI00399CC0E4